MEGVDDSLLRIIMKMQQKFLLQGHIQGIELSIALFK
jgi:hypothetical protein